MPFTTGWVTNTRDFGTAASNIVVNFKNNDQVNSATIILGIFASVDSSSFVPVYAQSFLLPPNTSQVMTYFISGNVAYEVQFEEIMPLTNNTVLTVYGIDEFGNLVNNQRFTPPELAFIDVLSPLS
ncbi:hypothetical protein [Paenibacillus sp. CF384]|uniref:hypothetical protein n=1 Tax=Paenibacillus sp. CF384 TaxID=1884382 RepID=UPI000899149B|nr:hypothetical protein [Paenibacillus sp. CF384]SDX72152.1 hypothetical protein SAMN05518855_1019120 [Paenibacillus sp. CF384]